jgi:lethal(2) giant larvae protein
LVLHADGQLIAASTSYGIGIFDLVRMKTIYTNSVTTSTGVKISRSRSFQKTLRDSFRQLRRHKSYDVSEPKSSQKAETKPSEAVTESQPEIGAKPTETEVVIEKVGEMAEEVGKAPEKELESPKIEEIAEKTEKADTKMEETKGEKLAVTEGEEKVEKKETSEAEIVVEEIPKEEPAAAETVLSNVDDKAAEGEVAMAVPTSPTREKKPTKDESPAAPVMTTIQTVQFADTVLLQGQATCTSLWIGTSSGHVFIYRLTLPDAEKRHDEDVVCVLVKEIRLKHGAPIVGLFFVDRNMRPLVESVHKVSVEGDVTGGGSTTEPVGGHRVIVCSQQQAKIFSLPNLKAHGKYKLPLLRDDVHFTDAVLATFVSKSDDAYSEADLVCLTNQHKLIILSVPHLRCQLQTDSFVTKTETSGESGLTVLTLSGGVFHCLAGELNEFSVAARPSAPRCSVQLKDGMRPVPVVVAEAAETATDAPVATEAAGDKDEPVAAAPEELHETCDKPVVSAVEVKLADESVISANDSMGAGDVTADSIKVHVSLKDEASVGDSNIVASHKVIETSVHSVKTVGGTVSESTTTTVEELKTVEGLMSTCTISSSSATTTTTASSVVKVEGN